jgi:hypothetical protein
MTRLDMRPNLVAAEWCLVVRSLSIRQAWKVKLMEWQRGSEPKCNQDSRVSELVNEWDIQWWVIWGYCFAAEGTTFCHNGRDWFLRVHHESHLHRPTMIVWDMLNEHPMERSKENWDSKVRVWLFDRMAPLPIPLVFLDGNERSSWIIDIWFTSKELAFESAEKSLYNYW